MQLLKLEAMRLNVENYYRSEMERFCAEDEDAEMNLDTIDEVLVKIRACETLGAIADVLIADGVFAGGDDVDGDRADAYEFIAFAQLDA